MIFSQIREQIGIYCNLWFRTIFYKEGLKYRIKLGEMNIDFFYNLISGFGKGYC